jgi:hypothetical protein
VTAPAPRTPETGEAPLDARLLSEAVIELNISRRNVAIYPAGHPSVGRSLARAHDRLARLLELRPAITIAVAKDTLVIDSSCLDRRNPVYREFALHLSRLGIASLTFRAGLSQDELYQFHRVLAAEGTTPAGSDYGRLLGEAGVTHVGLGRVDYAGFVFQEGEAREADTGPGLWERYVHALIQGTLVTEEAASAIRDVPPETLARFVNSSRAEDLKEQSYDRVISTYIRQSSERHFSSRELTKILDFVGGLKPELKRQFLASAVKLVSSDLEATERALGGMQVEQVLGLLSAINEQQLLIPEALRNLIVTLSRLADTVPEDRTYEGSLLADDHVISPEVVELLGSGSFSSFVTESYQTEIRKLLQFDAAKAVSDKAADILHECTEERIEQDFTTLLGELICSDVIPEEDYRSFVDLMAQEAEGLLATGRYEQVLASIGLLELNARQGRHPAVTAEALGRFDAPEFRRKLVDSLAIFGRQHREEAQTLCNRYGERLLPLLIEALIAERSQAVRRYLIGLIAGHGKDAATEVLKRLDDTRWFVQRNMIFLLGECDPDGALPQVRPLCGSGNPKVSFEAIRYVLRAGDPSGVRPLLGHLRSGETAVVEQAIGIAGALKVRDAVPQLLQLLARKAVTGADFLERIPVVKALGDIADERALPALRELTAARSLLFRGELERVRDEVFLTLKRFPFAAVRDLVEKGSRSGSERVREECRRLLEANRG